MCIYIYIWFCIQYTELFGRSNLALQTETLPQSDLHSDLQHVLVSPFRVVCHLLWSPHCPPVYLLCRTQHRHCPLACGKHHSNFFWRRRKFSSTAFRFVRRFRHDLQWNSPLSAWHVLGHSQYNAELIPLVPFRNETVCSCRWSPVSRIFSRLWCSSGFCARSGLVHIVHFPWSN